jgi:hypothetical protein
VNLYLVERTDVIGYDQHDAAVVRAASEADARELASSYTLGGPGWHDNSFTAQLVTEEGERDVVLASFRAG